MKYDEKIQWMAVWAAKNGLRLELAGECGFGRECVGVLTEHQYPDYEWCNGDDYERADKNGEVWTPKDAYHKHPCVAVLGRGEEAEAQLYDWLRWFDDNGFVAETGDTPKTEWEGLGIIGVIMGKHRYARMVKK